ncbi:transketolase subunit B [Tessaracoccus bendigoensis DSM 12906]|uniref:Transketolase subunit B n=1 Tax=Tessaracoccus bendigoensis DSM 12906 TaxID=1123357 RepID=A0A1M6I4E6_9ACTN|nr:transketolase C-terminal domain-containing protein [Tessaracoccus bendigoensis]SHJ29295.1 transketolase subunit B [Tessaracoccus bendigoensis DSM 12906]
MKAQRAVWGETLVKLAREDSRVVVLDADLATSTQAVNMANELPESFLEMGIAEANMVGVAMGMTTLGYRPWLSTFGVFLTSRSLDQIRVLVSQTHAPVRVCAAYSGLLNGSAGKTHQDLEDLATMRAMPNMVVLAPADEFELAAMMAWIAEYDGPVYLRVARDAVAPVFDESYEFKPEAVVRIRDGADVTLVSTGVQTSRTLEAAQLLAGEGIEARVVHVPSLKPLDVAGLVSELADAKVVVTVEEHSIIGGLGGLVAEVVADELPGVRVVRHGLADKWSESAPTPYLLEKYGLGPRQVADKVVEVLNGGNEK